MKPFIFYKKTLLAILSIVNVAIFTSCQKDIPLILKYKGWKSGEPAVLVAGYESNGVINVAKCWINDQ
jgi:hypothetical protein